MNTPQLQKSLDELKKEQVRLQQAIALLEELVSGSRGNRLSPEGRARISEAARKRWEEHRRRAMSKQPAAIRTGQRHAA